MITCPKCCYAGPPLEDNQVEALCQIPAPSERPKIFSDVRDPPRAALYYWPNILDAGLVKIEIYLTPAGQKVVDAVGVAKEESDAS